MPAQICRRLSPAIPCRIPGQRREPNDNQRELQHLVVHRCAQAAQQDIRQYKHGRDHRRQQKAPSKNHLQDQRHRVQSDARDQYRKHGKRERVENPRRLAKAHFQKFRYAAHFAAVVNRHHHQGQKQHRGNGADPIEMHCAPAVFGAGGDHAHHFQRAAVRGHKGNAGDGQRQRPAGFEELLRGVIRCGAGGVRSAG